MRKTLVFVLSVILLCSCGTSKKITQEEINNLSYEEAVKVVVDDIIGKDAENLEITNSFYEEDCILVKYKFDGSSDSTRYVNQVFTEYINVCRRLYKHPNAKNIYFDISTDLIDSKGNVFDRSVVYLLMSVDKFNSFNWSNLCGRELSFESVESECLMFLIKDPIVKEFDNDKLMYLLEDSSLKD